MPVTVFNSISDAHRAFGLPKPVHPLISLVGSANVGEAVQGHSGPHVLNFYKISLTAPNGRVKYGQNYYDFGEGGLLFAAPQQLIGNDESLVEDCSVHALLIHPDFLLGHPLARSIRQYGFFSYAANEALHLSDEEKGIILSVFDMIKRELNSRIDDFSQAVILAQVELLLHYAQRFYKRQFLTRKAVNNDLLQQLEAFTDDYFANDAALAQGLPSVKLLAGQVHLSPSYLSDMLRTLTGQNAQQYIHGKLIEKAKEILSTTTLPVSEVAFRLGFEHAQSFSKLFKAKTNRSPLEFRRSFQ